MLYNLSFRKRVIHISTQKKGTHVLFGLLLYMLEFNSRMLTFVCYKMTLQTFFIQICSTNFTRIFNLNANITRFTRNNRIKHEDKGNYIKCKGKENKEWDKNIKTLEKQALNL
jgi:hypothetical protein